MRPKKLAFLAYAIAEHPAETRADLQRYYGLNLDRLGRDFGSFHAGACLACLPPGSALMARIDEATSWTATDHILWVIYQALVGKELPFPWDKRGSGLPDLEGVDVDEFKRWHEQDFEEVDRWQTL